MNKQLKFSWSFRWVWTDVWTNSEYKDSYQDSFLTLEEANKNIRAFSESKHKNRIIFFNQMCNEYIKSNREKVLSPRRSMSWCNSCDKNITPQEGQKCKICGKKNGRRRLKN